MKNNKIILTLILVLTIGIVGLTIAYFSNSSTITNTFNTNPYGTTVTEEFVSPQNWLPGTSTDKSLTVANTGNVDEAVRIRLTENWKTANNGTLNGWIHTDGTKSTHVSENELATDERVALINFTNPSDWTKVGDYYYYNYKLTPNQSTTSLIESVTFNSKTKLNDTCTTTLSEGTKTVTCNSSGSDYDNATYTLTFDIETVQYNKYKEAWGVSNNIAAMKPMNARELALKSNPISVTNYTDGDIHEMYTFHHDATEQTPALTDYRYIGNDPYNYVYFNCDSLDNQNSDTCEVWRIIGVFDVERPDPNDNTQTITERRMKLVRGKYIDKYTVFNSEGDIYNNQVSNNWSTSNINLFLNEYFYNKIDEAENYGLKNTSRNMVKEAVFYLGGGYYNDSTYGTTESIYEWERGTTVFNAATNSDCNYTITEIGKCSARPVKWSSKISLLYPSDYFFTYSLDVNDICFNNPSKCDKRNYYEIAQYVNGSLKITQIEKEPGSPERSWLYLANLTEYNYIKDFWLLSPLASTADHIFYIENSSANLKTANGGSNILPTLYLSSSVNIIDGDGSINNPYKLSNS